jgi:hypothetical protein
MKRLYERFQLILNVTGRPGVVAWWGIACYAVALTVIWATFIPSLPALFLAGFFAGMGVLLLWKAVDLKRRRDGGR